MANNKASRGRTFLRVGIRSIYFILILSVCSLYNWYLNNNDITSYSSSTAGHRRLNDQFDNTTMPPSSSSELACDDDDLRKADPAWFCIIYLLGVLYMFVAIAIVCDELFVPTLEEIASDRHANLSMDVAGATLMAAGGSAPELFTSIFGTFVQHSEVGIGTVVGSAVFNVLFVIAMCALCSKDVLALTWWPLFRDSSYYSMGLVVLGLFVGVISPSEIELWEALVLFGMYIGYVVMMAFNKRIYKRLTGKDLAIHTEDSTESSCEEESGEEEMDLPPAEQKGSDDAEDDDASPPNVNDDKAPSSSRALPPSKTKKIPITRRSSSSRVLESSVVSVCTTEAAKPSPTSSWPGTFRSGIIKLLRDPSSWVDTAGVGIVATIAGDVHEVFREVDVDSNGEIDKEELRQLFAKLDCDLPIDDEQLDSIMNELDENDDGKITEEDFTAWYIRSEQRISSRVGPVFDLFDTDNSGTLDRDKIQNLLETLEPGVTDADIEDAMTAMYRCGSRDEISFEEFSHWYVRSMAYERQAQRVEDELMGILDDIKPPPSGSGILSYAKYVFLLPIVAVLGVTVPDVRRPGCHKFCYVSFVLSIMWIGFFSYFMVDWAEIIGHTIGIPSVIMGLTLLAAGTSVPDLLTSVIVARMGEGDMALSSSIGSNIFDILVGLPLPWICYTAWNDSVIVIGSENVWVHIFTLLGMLVFVVVATHCQGWKLTRTLAVLMLIFYFGFLGMAISLEVPFETC